MALLQKAEREGFEPSRAFALRAFQARALGQTMRPLQNLAFKLYSTRDEEARFLRL